MQSNIKEFNFVAANPTLHTAAKRLTLPEPATHILTYFDDLINELIGELMRYLNSKHPNCELIIKHLPKKCGIDPKTSLFTLLNHCFPILYGLQQRQENLHQKMMNHYLRCKVNTAEERHKEKVRLLIHIFHQLTESKQLIHLVCQRLENQRIKINTHSTTFMITVKNEIQSHCNAMAKAFDQCRLIVATNNKEQNVFAGLISRSKGFCSFTDKKLRPYCTAAPMSVNS